MKIYITGTPGTGKTTLSNLLKVKIPNIKIFELNKLLKDLKLLIDYDSNHSTFIYDPWESISPLENFLNKFNDYALVGAPIPFEHIRWDCIVVLVCSNVHILRERLSKRNNYSETKINENLEAELVGEILGTAMDWLSPYGPIIQLDSCQYNLEELMNKLMQMLRF